MLKHVNFQIIRVSSRLKSLNTALPSKKKIKYARNHKSAYSRHTSSEVKTTKFLLFTEELSRNIFQLSAYSAYYLSLNTIFKAPGVFVSRYPNIDKHFSMPSEDVEQKQLDILFNKNTKDHMSNYFRIREGLEAAFTVLFKLTAPLFLGKYRSTTRASSILCNAFQRFTVIVKSIDRVGWSCRTFINGHTLDIRREGITAHTPAGDVAVSASKFRIFNYHIIRFFGFRVLYLLGTYAPYTDQDLDFLIDQFIDIKTRKNESRQKPDEIRENSPRNTEILV